MIAVVSAKVPDESVNFVSNLKGFIFAFVSSYKWLELRGFPVNDGRREKFSF